MNNKYNSYNSNNVAYEEGINNEEDCVTYEDGDGTNATHEGGTNYTYSPTSNK